jgi:glutamate-1-semialdehyde aminotransferase
MRNHDRALNRAFIDWLTAHGVYTKPKRVNRFMISAAHTEDDIRRTVEVVEGFLVKHQQALR